MSRLRREGIPPLPLLRILPQVSLTIPEISVGTTIDTGTVEQWSELTRAPLNNAGTRFVCAIPVVTCNVEVDDNDEHISIPIYCITANPRLTDLESDSDLVWLTWRGKEATEERWIDVMSSNNPIKFTDLEIVDETPAESSWLARRLSTAFCSPDHSSKLEKGGVTSLRSEHSDPDIYQEVLVSRVGDCVNRRGRTAKYNIKWISDVHVSANKNTQLTQVENLAFK